MSGNQSLPVIPLPALLTCSKQLNNLVRATMPYQLSGCPQPGAYAGCIAHLLVPPGLTLNIWINPLILESGSIRLKIIRQNVLYIAFKDTR